MAWQLGAAPCPAPRGDAADAVPVLHCRTHCVQRHTPAAFARGALGGGVFLPGSVRLAESPGRLFVCARCRVPVVLCSRCDRGQRYCGRTCSRAARRGSTREAARRYQHSRGGRLAHAARSRRWRQRQRLREGRTPEANIVTHQGSQGAVGGASLAACQAEPTPCLTPRAASAFGPWRCRRCGRALPALVRQGFLRHGPGSRWLGHAQDHSP